MTDTSDLREAIQAAIQANFPGPVQATVERFIFSELVMNAHIELAPAELLLAELNQREGGTPDRNYFRHVDALRALEVLANQYPADIAAGACKMAREILNDCEKADELYRRIGYLAYQLIELGVPIVRNEPQQSTGKVNRDLN